MYRRTQQDNLGPRKWLPVSQRSMRCSVWKHLARKLARQVPRPRGSPSAVVLIPGDSIPALAKPAGAPGWEPGHRPPCNLGFLLFWRLARTDLSSDRKESAGRAELLGQPERSPETHFPSAWNKESTIWRLGSSSAVNATAPAWEEQNPSRPPPHKCSGTTMPAIQHSELRWLA